MRISRVYFYKSLPFPFAQSFYGGKLTFTPIAIAKEFLLKIFVALAIPVDVPGHDGLFFAYHIEAVYLLPRANDSVLTYPPIINKRSLSRAQLYENVEKHFERYKGTKSEVLIKTVLFPGKVTAVKIA